MIKIGCLDFYEFPREGKYDKIYGGKEQEGPEFNSILINPLINNGIEVKTCNCLEEECDIVFISCYPRHLEHFIKGNPIMIYWTYESMYKFNIVLPYDYSISFYSDSDTNLHYPWWQHEYWRFKEIYNPNKSDINKNNFCAFIASNTDFIKPNFNDGVYLREYIAQELTKTYKKVDCYGYTKINNMEGALIPWNLEEANNIVSNYKFYLCFENSLCGNDEHYTTEKLINGFAYNCVPIYWGNHSEYLDKYFNPKSYINCTGMTPAEIIETIKYYDTHDDEYYAMLNENPFNDMNVNWKDYAETRYVNFIKKIIEERLTNNDIDDSNYKMYIYNNSECISDNIKEYLDYSDFTKYNYAFVSNPGVYIEGYNNILYESDTENIFRFSNSIRDFCKTYYIYHNVNYRDYEYIGICNEDKYWLKYELNRLPQIFEESDVILPKLFDNPDGVNNYTRIKWGCGNIDEFIDIVNEKFPLYKGVLERELNETQMYSHNMMIIKSMYLKNYVNFIWEIINTYLEKHNITSDDDILDIVINNPSLYYWEEGDDVNTPQEAASYLSTVIEFLSHVFFKYNFVNIYEANYKFVDTEDSKDLYNIIQPKKIKIYVCNHLEEEDYNSLYDANKYIDNYSDYFTFISYPIRNDIPGYKSLSISQEEIDNDENCIFHYDLLYSEYAKLYYAYTHDNLDNIEIVGNAHYRRFFLENVYGSIEELMSKYDIIIPDPDAQTKDAQVDWRRLIFENINEINLLHIDFSKYGLDEDILYNAPFYVCNMFIMSKDNFIKYMEWSSKILFDIQHQMKIFTKEDYWNYIDASKNKDIIEKAFNSLDSNHRELLFNNPNIITQLLLRYIAYISEILFAYWVNKNFDADKILIKPILTGSAEKHDENELKVYVINHLPDIDDKLKDIFNMYYYKWYSFLSYPQTEIRYCNNTLYNIHTANHIFQFDHSIGELSKIYYIVKNEDYRKYKYIGLAHYRRMWFGSDLDTINEIFSFHDCIVPKPSPHEETNYERVKYGCGNLDEFIDICKEKFPEYSETLEIELNNKELYSHNILIIKSEDLEDYFNFMYTIAFEYINRYGFKDDKDIREYVINHRDLFYYDEENGASIYSACRYINSALEFFNHLYVKHNYHSIYEAEYNFYSDIYSQAVDDENIIVNEKESDTVEENSNTVEENKKEPVLHVFTLATNVNNNCLNNSCLDNQISTINKCFPNMKKTFTIMSNITDTDYNPCLLNDTIELYSYHVPNMFCDFIALNKFKFMTDFISKFDWNDDYFLFIDANTKFIDKPIEYWEKQYNDLISHDLIFSYAPLFSELRLDYFNQDYNNYMKEFDGYSAYYPINYESSVYVQTSIILGSIKALHELDNDIYNFIKEDLRSDRYRHLPAVCEESYCNKIVNDFIEGRSSKYNILANSCLIYTPDCYLEEHIDNYMVTQNTTI